MTKASPNRLVRVGPVLIDSQCGNLLTPLLSRDLREVMAADLGERLDKPGLEQWRRRDRLLLAGPAGHPRVFYLKRFTHPPMDEQLARIASRHLWRSTAGVELDNIRRLEALGVPTMRAAAFAQKMIGPWERCSLICTEQVRGESLERWLPKRWQEAVDAFGPRWRARTIVQLADVISRMHRGLLCHRDLYTAHIFIDVDDSGRTQFHLIDLQRMIRLGWRRRRWWVKDLAALAGSAPVGLIRRTDRLRFLLAYLGLNRLDPRAKRWWRDVRNKAERMMRHHTARMARLAAGSRR